MKICKYRTYFFADRSYIILFYQDFKFENENEKMETGTVWWDLFIDLSRGDFQICEPENSKNPNTSENIKLIDFCHHALAISIKDEIAIEVKSAMIPKLMKLGKEWIEKYRKDITGFESFMKESHIKGRLFE